MIPCSETRPKVGLMHVSPSAVPGPITEPPVCVPSAPMTCRDATAAPLPDDEPLGPYVGSFGLHALRVVGSSVPYFWALPPARLPIWHLPMITPPAWRSSRTAVAS